MGYEILTDDVVDNGDKTPPPRKRRVALAPVNARVLRPAPTVTNSKLLIINIFIILILILGAYLFFTGFFESGEDEVQKEPIEVIGKLKNLSQYYNGDLTVSGNMFLLSTSLGDFTEGVDEFELIGFNGTFIYENRSLVVLGTADKIIHGKNNLNINGEEFKLELKRNFETSLFLDESQFHFDNGKLIFNRQLKYDFDNASIGFKNFSATIAYDGKFSVFGTADEFSINTPKNNLMLLYKDD
jgi:hypothetical protein